MFESIRKYVDIRGWLISVSLLAPVALLFLTAPTRYDFWWSDAARHAMDGAFFLEFFRDMPLSDPVGYAKSFYLKYPAIAIVFYPPLFAVAEAGVFALFGGSHLSAQLTVMIFFFALAVGCYRLSRRSLSPPLSLTVCFLFIGAHEVAFWGRQVMLEIPTYAFLIGSIHYLIEFIEKGKAKYLYVATLLFVCGLYTKLNVVFMAPFMAFWLFSHTNVSTIKRPCMILSVVAAVVLILPLAWITVNYGKTNVGAVVGGQAAGELPRLSPAAWLYYLKRIPGQIGPFQTALLAVAAVVAIVRRSRFTAEDRRTLLFYAGWFIWGYLFFSMISLKEPRHTIFLLFPLIFLSVFIITRGILDDSRGEGGFRPSPSRAEVGVLIVGVAILANTIFADEVPFVRNHHEAARFVSDRTPEGYRVLIHSYWDGNFIFSLWCERRGETDIPTLRSDKLLLSMAVKRSMGVAEKALSDAEIVRMLDDFGVYYLVCETGFWSDLDIMDRFETLLATSPRFAEVRRIPLETGFVSPKYLPRYRAAAYRETADSDAPSKGAELVVYRNLNARLPVRPLHIDVPIIGITINETDKADHHE